MDLNIVIIRPVYSVHENVIGSGSCIKMIKVKNRESFEHGVDWILAGIRFAQGNESSVIYRYARERGIDVKCMRDSISAMKDYFELTLTDGRSKGWNGVFEFEE